jgi:hypothetical protein
LKKKANKTSAMMTALTALTTVAIPSQARNIETPLKERSLDC